MSPGPRPRRDAAWIAIGAHRRDFTAAGSTITPAAVAPRSAESRSAAVANQIALGARRCVFGAPPVVMWPSRWRRAPPPRRR